MNVPFFSDIFDMIRTNRYMTNVAFSVLRVQSQTNKKKKKIEQNIFWNYRILETKKRKKNVIITVRIEQL